MEITEQQWRSFTGFMKDADAEKHKTRRRGRGKAQKAPGAILGYNTNRYPGSFVTDELHHAVPLARMMPLFRTIRNKEQLGQLLSAFESRGVRLGDSFENTFAIDKRFHDSADPRSIHRIEQEMEDSERYVPMGATFEEALGAVDAIAQDATSSKNRIREIQFGETQVGDMSRLKEMVLAPTEQTQSPQERRAVFRESKAKDLGGKNPFAKNVNILPEQQSVKHGRDVYARQQNVKGNPGLANLEYRGGAVRTRYFPNRLVGGIVDDFNTIETFAQMQGAAPGELAAKSAETTKKQEKMAEMAREKGGLFGMPDLGISEQLFGRSMVQDERQKYAR